MELTAMKNIGAEMQRKLNAIGFDSAEELTRTGSKEAYFRLKSSYPEVCLVHLYVLQGAIDNIAFNLLPQNIKNELKAFSDNLK
ncbi:MAG: TfoX/Sxy family DNA transformation protein [Christensenella sp.]|uniref:TfoX/Sxy family DNA transformation protein n=1 Tax=Christensenella sp. TaxID=1935934 RepID=UPI002B1ECA7A|nr:TfoX/Sxy family DNA transformation protein [Christensenella sp.]MEA5002221.1 TfoX/Sxy family DNA transformation protein [Christensenella sp.]